MKLARLTDSRFQAAMSRLSAQSVPLKVAFKLKGIIAKMNEELRKFDEVRNEALMKYGKKGEDGSLLFNNNKSVQIDPDQMQAFIVEMNDLGNTDVEIPSIAMSELGDNIQLTADDATVLDTILVE